MASLLATPTSYLGRRAPPAARRRAVRGPVRPSASATGPAGGRGSGASASKAPAVPAPPPPAALVPPPPSPDALPDAFALLGLNRAASRDTVSRTYERLLADVPSEAGYSEVQHTKGGGGESDALRLERERPGGRRLDFVCTLCELSRPLHARSMDGGALRSIQLWAWMAELGQRSGEAHPKPSAVGLPNGRV